MKWIVIIASLIILFIISGILSSFAFFFGDFGAHRFYLGKIGTAIAMFLTLGGLGIWSLVDFIMAVSGVMRDREGKLIKGW